MHFSGFVSHRQTNYKVFDTRSLGLSKVSHCKKEKKPPSCDSAKFAFQPERLTGRFFHLSKVTKSRILNRKLILGGGGGPGK